MKEAKRERVVSHFDNRERSREAMVSLLRFAQTKKESGVKASFPLDALTRANDYFNMWQRKKMFENMAFWLPLAAITPLFFSFTSGFNVALLLAYQSAIFSLYMVFRLDKRKCIYIKEMLGNTIALGKERDYYIRGLRSVIYSIEKEEVKKTHFVWVFLFLMSSMSMQYANSIQLKTIFFSMSIVFVIVFFGIDLIREVKK